MLNYQLLYKHGVKITSELGVYQLSVAGSAAAAAVRSTQKQVKAGPYHLG